MLSESENSNLIVDVPVIFFHGNLVSNNSKKQLAKHLNEGDELLETGLIFGPVVDDKLTNLCFISNKDCLDNKIQNNNTELIFLEYNFRYDGEDHMYDNLALKFYNNTLALILKNNGQTILYLDQQDTDKFKPYVKNVAKFKYGLAFNRHNMTSIIIEVCKIYNNNILETREIKFYKNTVNLENENILIVYENKEVYDLRECYLKKVDDEKMIYLESKSKSSDNDTIIHGGVKLF